MSRGTGDFIKLVCDQGKASGSLYKSKMHQLSQNRECQQGFYKVCASLCPHYKEMEVLRFRVSQGQVLKCLSD